MCCVGGHLKVLGSTPSMISDVLYGTSPFCQSLSPHLRGPPNIHSPSSRSFFCRQRRAVLRRLRVTRVRTRSASGPFSRAHLTAPYTSMILLFFSCNVLCVTITRSRILAAAVAIWEGENTYPPCRPLPAARPRKWASELRSRHGVLPASQHNRPLHTR